MPRKIGTENWRKKRRQEHLEMKEYRYYIFCEGEQTEPRYFSGFKKLIEDNPSSETVFKIAIEDLVFWFYLASTSKFYQGSGPFSIHLKDESRKICNSSIHAGFTRIH